MEVSLDKPTAGNQASYGHDQPSEDSDSDLWEDYDSEEDPPKDGNVGSPNGGDDGDDEDEDQYEEGAELFDIGVWDIMRTTHSETVRYNDRCRYCSTIKFKEFMRAEHPYEMNPRVDSTHELSFPIQDFGQKPSCWVCRFIFRICARVMTRDVFRKFWRHDTVVVLRQTLGLLAHRLMISKDEQPCCQISLRTRSGSQPDSINEYTQCSSDLHEFLVTCQERNKASPIALNEVLTTSLHHGFLDYEILQSWISCCEQEHKQTCNLRIEPNVREKLYLIEVDSFNVVEAEPGSRYIALSYVLGGYQPSVKNGPWRVPGPLPDDLPRTVLDAVSVVQNMREKYLWVDLYCIPQDPTLRQKIIREMDFIYDGAFMTICALPGRRADSGLYGVSIPFRQPNQVVTSTKAETFMATYLPLLWLEFDDTAWGGRAWTFQEAALSRRRLCFSRQGVFLICKEELFHGLLKHDHSDNRVPNRVDTEQMEDLPFDIDLNHIKWSFGTYYRIVSAFCGRKLTYQSDAENAVTGPLNRMSTSSKVEFAYGLPVQDFLNALLFNRPTLPKRTSLSRDATTLKRRPGFPSWSWLGWQGNLTYPFWLSKSDQDSIYHLVGIMSTYYYAVKVCQSASIKLEQSSGSKNSSLLIASEVARFRFRRTKQEESERIDDGLGILPTVIHLTPAPLLREIDRQLYLASGAGNETLNRITHPSQRRGTTATAKKLNVLPPPSESSSDQMVKPDLIEGGGKTKGTDSRRNSMGNLAHKGVESVSEIGDELVGGDEIECSSSISLNEGNFEDNPLMSAKYVWQLLDEDGKVLPCSRTRLLYGDKLGNTASTEHLRLPDDITLEFLRTGDKVFELEFVLLQHWLSHLDALDGLSPLQESKEVEEMWRRFYDFGSEVWVMGIRKTGGGSWKGGEPNSSNVLGDWERVCVLMMPLEQWMAAKPEKATIRVV